MLTMRTWTVGYIFGLGKDRTGEHDGEMKVYFLEGVSMTCLPEEGIVDEVH